MIQSVFILNPTGEIIIEKHYRGLLGRQLCDLFWTEASKYPNPEEVPVVIQTPRNYIVHVQRDGLFFLAILAFEVPPLLILEFLHRICDIFKSYFGSLNEGSLRDNFVIVYQLMEEMMDNGIPFTTEPNSLMEMIPPANFARKIQTGITGSSQFGTELPVGQLSNTPWRKTGVKYTTNEVYLDVIEEIDSTIEANGLVVSSEVSGEIQVACRLSGMPDLTLAFTNSMIMDDVGFHPCVRYQRWEQGRVISFVPPDGNFQLMTFRVKGQLQLPIYVKPQITFNDTGGRVTVMAGTKGFGNLNERVIEDVVVIIPFSKAIGTVNFNVNQGSISFDEVTKNCRWILGKITKDKSPFLEGTVTLAPGAAVPDSNPTLTAEFKIMQYSASGLKVDHLSLLNERYKPYKGVKFMTKAGKFCIRS